MCFVYLSILKTANKSSFNTFCFAYFESLPHDATTNIQYRFFAICIDGVVAHWPGRRPGRGKHVPAFPGELVQFSQDRHGLT